MAAVQGYAIASSGGAVQRTDDPRAERTFTLFSLLWAVFTLFHQARWTFWTRTPIESLQTAAALAVLFRPSSLGAFLALVFIQMADLMYAMPNISNHSIFAMFVNVTIIVAVLIEVLRRRGLPLEGGRLLRLFAPAVRLEVIALYFWVVVHKLNTDFLNPESSCATNHYQHLSGMVNRAFGVGLPEGTALMTLTVWLTLIVESAIPILLLRPRTSIAGVMLGLLFHYVLGINVYHDFSGMIFALYLLFLPPNFAEEAVAWLRTATTRAGILARKAAAVVRAVPLPTLAAVGAVGALLAAGNAWRTLHPLFYVLWVIYGATCIALFTGVLHGRSARFEFESGRFRTHPVLLAIPVIVLLNGMLPYLGLKTENSFAMFSNLRTEGGKSNHLLFPVSLQVFDFQKDMVAIKHSSDSYLENSRGTSMPFIMLVDRVRRQRQRGFKNIEVSYERGGVERHVRNAESDPELTTSYPWYAHKLQRFRLVDNQPRQACRH